MRTRDRSASRKCALSVRTRVTMAWIRCGTLSTGLLALIPNATALDPTKAITQYHQDVWTERDGLPQDSVQAITQTRDGYLWIGTRDGLARFDGVTFTVYRAENQPGLESNDIRALCEDSAGRLWIGTFNGGLSRYADGEFICYNRNDGLGSSGVVDIVEDRKGDLWIGTWNGVTRRHGEEFTTYGGAEGLTGASGWTICASDNGNIWIGTGTGLNEFCGDRFRFFNAHDGLPNNLARKVYLDRQGQFWVGTIGGGLCRFSEGKPVVYTTRDGLADNKVRTIYEDRHDNLWIGTWNGLSRMSEGKITSYAKRDGLPHDYVETLFEDREGSLWIGTHGGGLARLRDGKFAIYTTKEGLVDNFTKCVFQSRDGTLWVGSNGGGLSRYRNGHFTNYTTRDGLPSNFVRSIGEDGAGNIWIGTGRPAGLCLYRDGTFVSQTQRQGLPIQQGVRAIFGDRAGNLWIGGDGGGLVRYRDGVFSVLSIEDGLLSSLIRVIAEDRAGDLWIGTNDGLCRLRNGQLTGYTVNDGLSHNAVYAIYEAADGTLWFGTQRGVTRYRDGKFQAYTTRDGLFQNIIFQILEDGNQNLWMSGNRGIFSLAKSAVDEFDRHRIQSLPCIPYGTADGMRTSQCEGGSLPAGWRTVDGALWFPTGNGLARIDPGHTQSNTLPPPVLVERVVAGSREIDARQSARVPPGTDEFRFHYTALSLVAPEKVRFKYRLDGIDNDWVDAGPQRVAVYNKIPPGQYNFRVIACNNDGVWNSKGAMFAFYLEPHFHQTAWFLALCGSMAALAAWSFHRLRMKQAEAQFSVVLTERNRIARDLHDTLAQGFAGIAFQLEAVATKLTEAPAQAQQHLNLALNMVRHSLAEARRSVMNLRSATLNSRDLAGALAETARQICAHRPVDLNIQTIGSPQSLSAKVEDNLLRVGQEAITNAFKHSHAGRIRIEVGYHPDRVTLRIQDDGKGFDATAPTSGSSGAHFGLLGMRERAKQIGGRLRVKSAPGAGTTIELDVPIPLNPSLP